MAIGVVESVGIGQFDDQSPAGLGMLKFDPFVNNYNLQYKIA
jgi:hypothetical protein